MSQRTLVPPLNDLVKDGRRAKDERTGKQRVAGPWAGRGLRTASRSGVRAVHGPVGIDAAAVPAGRAPEPGLPPGDEPACAVRAARGGVVADRRGTTGARA